MAAYLRRFGLTFVLFVLAAAAIDLFVDPYRLWNWPLALGEDAPRPRAVQHDAFLKIRGIARTRPVTLILGNSRAEIGLNPQARQWPDEAKPVYNAAVPGTGIRVARDMLAAAIAAGRLRHAIVGVDFLDFLVEPGEVVRAPEPADPSRLATGDLSIILSSDALYDSIWTLLAKYDPDAGDITANGFNPLHEYRRYVRQEGYGSLFQKKDLEFARRYANSSKSVFVESSSTSSGWEEFGALLKTARNHGVDVTFVLYPYHALMLEMFYKAGLAPAFKNWKLALVRRVADISDNCPLWDFSSYNDVTTEAVPALGDRKTEMRWYWESGHFKAELGDRIIGRIMNDGTDFGVCLKGENVLAKNQELDRMHASFVNRFPEAASNIAKLFGSVTP